jgi:hypothetical protein
VLTVEIEVVPDVRGRALERIGSDSPRDRRVGVEVRAASVREHARWRRGEATAAEALPAASPRRADLQPALSVLGRRSTREAMDLTGGDPRGAHRRGAHLVQADRSDADLTGASLSDAVLTRAALRSATGATRAHLAEAAEGGRGAQLPAGWR